MSLRLRHFYGASTLRAVAAAIEAELVAGVDAAELATVIAEAAAAAAGEVAS